MAFFNETVAAVAAGRTVRSSLLVFFDFEDEPKRLWPGNGPIMHGGYQWQGIGQLGSIDGLDQAYGSSAPQMTFTLSGVDAGIVTLAREASDRVFGRDVVVYIGFFDEAWQALDAPYAVNVGIMDQMRYGARGATDRSVTVTAEGLWTNRRRPAFSLYTDRDQNARFPGDRGLEQIPSLINKTARWPTY